MTDLPRSGESNLTSGDSMRSDSGPRSPSTEKSTTHETVPPVTPEPPQLKARKLPEARFLFANPQWDQFVVPWRKMPWLLRKNLNRGERPKPSDRREMVRIIIDDLVRYGPFPSQRICSSIAKKMVEEYPASLQDQLGGERVGTGYNSIAKQLTTRLNNVNRKNPRKLILKEVKGPLAWRNESYGCTNWQPMCPEGETDESLTEAKEELKNLHEEGSYFTEGKKDIIAKKMKSTYFAQRRDINLGATVAELLVEWPFLFREDGLLAHFRELVQIDLRATLSSTLERKRPHIMSFMETVHDGGIVSVWKSLTGNEFPAGSTTSETLVMVLLLMVYFEEKTDAVLPVADVTASSKEVEAIVPSTPCIVACGDTLLSSSRFMISIDSMVIMDDIESFDTALMLYMAAIYCFNCEYPPECSSVLEFVQRCFMRINPDSGSKSSKSKSIGGMDTKLLALIQQLADHELANRDRPTAR